MNKDNSEKGTIGQEQLWTGTSEKGQSEMEISEKGQFRIWTNLKKDNSEQEYLQTDGFEKGTSEKGHFWKGRS